MTSLLLVIIYVAFISLGLPDSILGAAWPSMFEYLNVPVGYAGIITMIIAGNTIISSLASNFLNKKLGTAKVMVISVGITALALFGFSRSTAFWHLCLLGIPYGLGAGSVDSALNNYVSLHYKARHMSWLHCFWGIGTMIGPIVMSSFIANGGIWSEGYKSVSIFQLVLVIILVLSLPLWKKVEASEAKTVSEDSSKNDITLAKAIKRPGVISTILTFFCYCATESTIGLWASTYMVFVRKIDIGLATNWAMLFYAGITFGRFLNGFIAEKLGDKTMVRIGSFIIIAGLVIIVLSGFGKWVVFAGFVLTGIGCAPIYPSIIHSTPSNFGKEYSQALIGLQMASAYTGSTFMPPIFGIIIQKLSISFLPFLGLLLVFLLLILFEISCFKVKKASAKN